MQIRRRELLAMVATGLAGCQTLETPEQERRGATGNTRPLASETPDARRQSPEEEPTTSQELSTTTAVPVRNIEVIERAGWGAAAPGEGMVQHTIERLTVHHTGVELEDNRQSPSRLRDHQSLHQADRGWPDLAYHFAIDRDGNVYEGRSPKFRGDTATSYDPTGHFLVAMEGNFDVEVVAEPQRLSLIDVLAWGAGTFRVAAETVKGHRDYAVDETSCPGLNLYNLITSGDLATEVASVASAGGIELTFLRGDSATERVASIEA